MARSATVTTSGDHDAETSPPSLLTDGLVDLRRNELRWLSHAQTPNWVEFRWAKPVTISAARIISGYTSAAQTTAPIQSFAMQTFDGTRWRDIEATRTTGNDQVDWRCRFEPVVADRLRLQVQATNIDISRIWEVELYAPAKDGRPRQD